MVHLLSSAKIANLRSLLKFICLVFHIATSGVIVVVKQFVLTAEFHDLYETQPVLIFNKELNSENFQKVIKNLTVVFIWTRGGQPFIKSRPL